MKNILIALFLFATMITTVNAQSKMAVGAGLVVSLPMGDFGKAANTGFGGTAAFELKFTPQITGVGHIGYISYGSESKYVSFSSVPLLVGAKYYFQTGAEFYGIGLIGFNFFSSTVETPSFDFLGSDFGGGSISSTSTDLTLAVGAGYELPIASNIDLDLSGTLQLISNYTNIQLRAGVKMAL